MSLAELAVCCFLALLVYVLARRYTRYQVSVIVPKLRVQCHKNTYLQQNCLIKSSMTFNSRLAMAANRPKSICTTHGGLHSAWTSMHSGLQHLQS